jgi:hypothetical protein
MDSPGGGSRFACPWTYRPDLVPAVRRRLGLDPGDAVPRCWSWGCEPCAELKSWGVRRYVKGGLLDAGARGDRVVFWTLTEPPLARSWDASSAALTRLLRAEEHRLRRELLPLPRWVAVPELQRRGAVHWHGLVALAPDSLEVTAWRSAHRLHDRAHAFGFGFQADRQDVEVRGSSAALTAWYLSKYVTKDQRAVDSVAPGSFRRVRSSIGGRRWAEWGNVGDHTRDYLGARARERDLLDLLDAAA